MFSRKYGFPCASNSTGRFLKHMGSSSAESEDSRRTPEVGVGSAKPIEQRTERVIDRGELLGKRRRVPHDGLESVRNGCDTAVGVRERPRDRNQVSSEREHHKGDGDQR